MAGLVVKMMATRVEETRLQHLGSEERYMYLNYPENFASDHPMIFPTKTCTLLHTAFAYRVGRQSHVHMSQWYVCYQSRRL